MIAAIRGLQFALIACLPAVAAPVGQDACQYFFVTLQAVPHETLSHSNGVHRSLRDGKKHTGCEIKLITTDRLRSGTTIPDLEAAKGSEMYRSGWRTNNAYGAGGPGTGLVGVEKESVLCLIRHGQPASLQDHGVIVQSEALTLTVQCRNK